MHHSLRQALHRQHPLRVGRGPSGGRQIRSARITAPTFTKQLFKVGQPNKSPQSSELIVNEEMAGRGSWF